MILRLLYLEHDYKTDQQTTANKRALMIDSEAAVWRNNTAQHSPRSIALILLQYKSINVRRRRRKRRKKEVRKKP